jgi:serine/threonine protein kinase
MPVRLVPHEELPPPLNGYRLLERLGRGGFGEVSKAAKFVFGDLDAVDDDESRPAEQEFKALNRVKLIRHPYLLSLERFEAIEGQLIIIMELADRNLWDRFRECRGHAQPGIPRSELLRYMDETAEALDLMNRDHNIQHLDVKPQNIFLVHSHVKVADFGLAKMFEGAQATVTGGVTPVYAAPETFEGWISRFSDQYSLAIVFQELLTGTRPFNGANTKQLLMQHLNGAPDLSALGPADQAVIGRALSKKPDDRWPSCGEMVQALRECGPRASTAGIPFPAPRLPGREDTPRPGAIIPPPASPASASSPSKSRSVKVAGSSAAAAPASAGSRDTGPAAWAASTASLNAVRNSGTDGAVAADSVRCSVAGIPRKAICGWTYHPRASISSAIVKTSHDPSAARASRVESGSATTRRPGMPSTPRAIARVASRAVRDSTAYPSMPIARVTAHAAASGPPDLVDCMVELSIVYPGHAAEAKKCPRRRVESRCSRRETPLGV